MSAPKAQDKASYRVKMADRKGCQMSALGQKQTCAAQKAMSALHPIATAKADKPQMGMSALPLKADLCSAFIYVCYNTR
jgi:hypothetical protein